MWFLQDTTLLTGGVWCEHCGVNTKRWPAQNVTHLWEGILSALCLVSVVSPQDHALSVTRYCLAISVMSKEWRAATIFYQVTEPAANVTQEVTKAKSVATQGVTQTMWRGYQLCVLSVWLPHMIVDKEQEFLVNSETVSKATKVNTYPVWWRYQICVL